MTQRPRIALCIGLLLLTAGCASNNNPRDVSGDPSATAPSTSTDAGSRYIDPADPIGAIPVETAPVDGTWTGGQTSIARPVGGTASGSPDAPAAQPPTQPVGPDGLPQPGVRRSPTPPPPPPLR